MKRFLAALLILLPLSAHAEPLPRTLLALYDSREEASPRTTLIHRFLEMPANHLGYAIEYHDINAPLPIPNADTRAILLWFNPGMEVPDADTYLTWLDAASARGIRLVILENMGLGDRWRATPAIMDHAARLLARIGVRDTNRWQSLTYSARISYASHAMTNFERPYAATLPSYMDTRATGNATSHLKIAFTEGKDTTTSDLIITSPQGGYAAAYYALYQTKSEDGSSFQQWYINPFLFLRLSLGADELPKPDVTTRGGLRLFFTLIDGNGWNDLSELPEMQKRQATSAEAIEQEILRAFPEIPFTVSPIGAELERGCYGLADSAKIAKRIFALSNVEPATHTYSQPLFWRFFSAYSTAKEKPYLSRYPARPKERSSLLYALAAFFRPGWDDNAPAEQYPQASLGRYDTTEAETLKDPTATPRGYACEPFSLARELSPKLINSLAPAPTRLLTWSGDTQPFPEAVAATAKQNLLNLGGGDVLYAQDYPSYAAFPPVGLQLGSARQIYAGNGNELVAPLIAPKASAPPTAYFQARAKATDAPLRIAPLILYAHMRAGVQQSELQTLKDDITYALATAPALATAADYAAIAEGFYTARISAIAPNRYRIEQRGALSTLRFDNATLKTVNYAQSTGVLGHQWRHGSLYVALDPDAPAPEITLKPIEIIGEYPADQRPYLLQAECVIKGLQNTNNSLIFTAYPRSVSKGDFTLWRMPRTGEYTITIAGEPPFTTHTTEEGLLEINIKASPPGGPLTVRIE